MELFFEILVIVVIVCFILYLFGFDEIFSIILLFAKLMWWILCVIAVGFLFGYGVKLAGG